MKQDKLPYRVKLRINKSKANVFILDDFADLSDYDQVLRALRRMVAEGRLVKIGQGIYAKIAENAPKPAKSIGDLAREALKKLGIKTANSSYMNAYNVNASTQIPSGRVIAVNRRVRRNIGFGGYNVKFEFMGRDYKKQWYNNLEGTQR